MMQLNFTTKVGSIFMDSENNIWVNIVWNIENDELKDLWFFAQDFNLAEHGNIQNAIDSFDSTAKSILADCVKSSSFGAYYQYA